MWFLLGIFIGFLLFSKGEDSGNDYRGFVRCKAPTYPRPEHPYKKSKDNTKQEEVK